VVEPLHGADRSEGVSAESGVVEVLLRYAEAIDTKDWDMLVSCFTESANFVATGLDLQGRGAISRFMQKSHVELDGSRHRLTNIRVVPGETDRTARATSYLDALLVRQGSPGGNTFQVIGTYHDSLTRDGSGWRISDRRFQRLWTSGDASILSPIGE